MRATLQALLPLLTQKQDGTHLVQAQKHFAKARKELDGLARGTPGKRLIHPQQIASAVNERDISCPGRRLGVLTGAGGTTRE